MLQRVGISTLVLAFGVASPGALPKSTVAQVVVPPGQPVQVVFLANPGSGFDAGFANAVQMAVHAHPTVRGHAIQIAPVQAATCGQPATAAHAAAVAAYKVAANRQNVAVLGQLCSFGFAQALPVYQNAGVVTISGSATNNSLASARRTVFDRTVLNDDMVDAWYTVVSQLPSDVAWQQTYVAQFGNAPPDFADLYYDATTLLISDLQRVSRVDAHNDLLINREALARAIRTTTGYPGVSCSITIDPTTGDRVDEPDALSACASG